MNKLIDLLLNLEEGDVINISIIEAVIEMKYLMLFSGNVIEEFIPNKGLFHKAKFPNDSTLYRFLCYLANSNGHVLNKADITNINHIVNFSLENERRKQIKKC